MVIDQQVIDLYDEYTHKPLPRRAFMERLVTLAGGAAAANALLPLLENSYARAGIVSPEDSHIAVSRISYEGASGPVASYLVKPKSAAKAPGVIVIHENRGLNPHIEDVARRVAKEGFVALAPDLLSPLGGTPADEDKARELIGQLDAKTTVENLLAARRWMASNPACTGKVGAVGFCWGGGMVNQLAVADPALNAGVVYYGMSPRPEQVASIKAPLLMHYAGLDTRIKGSVPAYEEALKAAHKNFTAYTYEAAQHAFNNDTNAARYDEKAAKLAWSRTIAFFRERLG